VILVPRIKSLGLLRSSKQSDGLTKLFKECECDPDSKKNSELVSKCKTCLNEYTTNVNSMDPLKFASDMKNESEFTNGLKSELIPWIDNAEKWTEQGLEKPKSFDNAREIEKQCAMFAKDVRKANKTLAKIEELATTLENNKTTAQQQIEEQKIRFKKIASVAASRVESMRDLLIRWQDMITSEEKDTMDFQPLTMFLKCYAVYFQ